MAEWVGLWEITETYHRKTANVRLRFAKFKEGTPPLDWQWLENSILPLSASSKPSVMLKMLENR